MDADEDIMSQWVRKRAERQECSLLQMLVPYN